MSQNTTPIILNGFCQPNNNDSPTHGFAFKFCDRQVVSLSQEFQIVSFPNLSSEQKETLAALRNSHNSAKSEANFERKRLHHSESFTRYEIYKRAERDANERLNSYITDIKANVTDSNKFAMFESSLGSIGLKLSFEQAAALSPLSNSHVIEIDNTNWKTPKIILRDPKSMLRPTPKKAPNKFRISS